MILAIKRNEFLCLRVISVGVNCQSLLREILIEVYSAIIDDAVFPLVKCCRQHLKSLETHSYQSEEVIFFRLFPLCSGYGEQRLLSLSLGKWHLSE